MNQYVDTVQTESLELLITAMRIADVDTLKAVLMEFQDRDLRKRLRSNVASVKENATVKPSSLRGDRSEVLESSDYGTKRN